MRDIVYLALIVGFFAIAAALVSACDRIVGPDTSDLEPGGVQPETETKAEVAV